MPMTRMTWARLAVLACACAAIAMGAGALALDRPSCEKYATAAVMQVRAAQASRCIPRTDGRWHFDANLHLQWCLGASSGQVRGEWNERTALLKKCTHGCPGHRCEDGW
jgi:hypothetical protein